MLLVGCAADVASSEAELALGDAEGVVEAGAQALASGTLRLNDVYFVPKRSGLTDAPMYQTATSSAVVRRVPEQAAVKIVIADPSNGRYRVDHAGTLGWMLADDLTLRHRYDSALPSARINALARARAAMGFSYWWSNARWPTTGPTIWPTDNTGSCSGTCGTAAGCTHAATGGTEYGADCSGFVSTIWGYPDYDPTTNPTNNGFSTTGFSQPSANWKTVALADAKAGDAVVIDDPSKHHIVLVATKRNTSGVFTTYECHGCAAGCTTYRREILDGSGWHAIRRTGW